MQNVTVIVDLQYGSTGKGLLAGYLAKRNQFTACVTAWGPNAGHTFVDADGHKYVHTQLANGIVSSHVREVFIGPGSVIDQDALAAEINALGDGVSSKLVIHANAVVLAPTHKRAECDLIKIGSTQKGFSAANVDRVRRDPDCVITAGQGALDSRFRPFVASPMEYSRRLRVHNEVLVEGHQGFSLSVYHGMYPYVTSRDTTTAAVLSDCGVDLPRRMTVYGTLRTYPIRVANRHDENGVQVGYSGPCYSDQEETSWDTIGVAPELTTVTKRIRRVFTYSRRQIREAARVNRVDRLFVNFLNYLPPLARPDFLSDLASDTGIKQTSMLYGLGASENDVYTETEYVDAD